MSDTPTPEALEWAIACAEELHDCDPGDGTPRGCGGVCRVCLRLVIETQEEELAERDREVIELLAALQLSVLGMKSSLRTWKAIQKDPKAIDGLRSVSDLSIPLERKIDRAEAAVALVRRRLGGD